MESKKIFVVGIFIIVVFSFVIISSRDSSVELVKGKNYVKLNISEPFYVDTLMELNPDIEAISYKEGNVTVGYISVFEGVGENFVMGDREYEIIVKENVALMLPY